MHRLWLSQIPNFVLAFHKDGVFEDEDIHVQDVSNKITDWEEDNQVLLRKFASLLKTIVSFARGWEDGRLELRREEGSSSTLEFRKQTGDIRRVLPSHLCDRWTKQVQGEQVTTAESPKSLPLDWYEDDTERKSDDESEEDFTACSAEDCGYCGHCRLLRTSRIVCVYHSSLPSPICLYQ